MEYMYYSSNLFKHVDREMVPIICNIYNIFFIQNVRQFFLTSYIWTGKLVN